MKFRNISKRPYENSWQLKFKINRKEIQPTVNSLQLAIVLRNAYYKHEFYRPANLFIHMFGLDVVRSCNETRKNGTIAKVFNVHIRRLRNRKYSPKRRVSKIDANEMAERWIAFHNEIAAIYNGERERQFLKQIDDELRTLMPSIESQFDLSLWIESAEIVKERHPVDILEFW